MNLPSAISMFAGGSGSGCNPAKGKCGRLSNRAIIAKRTFVPLTAAKLMVAKANERAVATAVKGTSTKDNAPFDVLIGMTTGIEVKTIFDTAKNNKITMHPESRERKLLFAHKNRLKNVFTVTFDERDGKVYYAKGVKSFRLRNMTETSLKQLGGVIK